MLGQCMLYTQTVYQLGYEKPITVELKLLDNSGEEIIISGVSPELYVIQASGELIFFKKSE